MRKAICFPVLIACLFSMSALGDHHERTPRIVEPSEVPYANQATWAATMLDARARVRKAGKKSVDLALGSAYARRFGRDFPIRSDWLMQDGGPEPEQWKGGLDGKRDYASYLKPGRDASLERKLIGRVLGECGRPGVELAAELNALVKAGAGPDDIRWLELYERACLIRRAERLKPLLARTRKIIFVRHQNMGNMNFAYTEYTRWPGNKYGGLFCFDLDKETIEPLIKTDKGGTIRDPALSYDGKRLLFAWRKDADDRHDYSVYEMELAGGKIRHITGDYTYGASYEPIYLPDGNIMFNSSRIVQTVDCAGPDVSNLFICDRDGKYARRIGFDQVHTLAPTVMDDGRVVYMRWDYNDRSQVYTQAIFQMNPDGTAQTEYYGNNTFEPTNFFHPRGIPQTAKIMCLIGGHHTPQSGKLVSVDPSKGRQGTDGLIEIPQGRKPNYERTDMYAKQGGHFCYPFPLDEKSLLVSYDSLAYHRRKKDGTRMPDDVKNFVRFHLYYMTTDGRREILAADHRISSLKAIPVISRKAPKVRPSTVDYRKKTGVYFMQDIYHGPGLKGVKRGTIKKLRVVELRFREMYVGANGTSGAGGSAGVVTPIAVGTGSWDVKVILGDAKVHADGSAMFEVPARTPVYFQALDAENRAVQTMRSWSTLMPGETFSCVGCHEDKNEAPQIPKTARLAMKAGPQELTEFYGPPRGFSYPKRIQPILDKHCIKCHKSGGKAAKYPLTSEKVHYKRSQRNWARSYLTLTGTPDRRRELHEERGRANEIVNWINNSSEPTMIPPRHTGSTRSKLMLLNDPENSPCPASIKLSRKELDMLAAWIDLVVPYCGDYLEANAWSEDTMRRAKKRIAMNQEARRIDLKNIGDYIKSGQ